MTVGMSKVIKHPVHGTYTWYAACGASGGGFGDKKSAEVALRLHQVGCKKC
jgi:hypothetical protein